MKTRCTLLLFISTVSTLGLARNFNDLLERNGESCFSILTNHTVGHKDCRTVVVQNNICVGACKTVTVPSIQGSGKCHILESRTCIYDKHRLVKIKLDCPKRKRKYKMKAYILAETCKCRNIKHLKKNWQRC